MATTPKGKAGGKAGGAEKDPPIELKGRLRRLKVRNFRAIGSEPVEVELDDIVVLVGPNNAGKSSILRAYEVAMLDGSKEGYLKLEDFPNSTLNPEALPEIELETEVVEGEPGEQWLIEQDRRKIVRERWVWMGTGAGKRSGWNAKTNAWDDKVPWGAPNVANSRRPLPHTVRAFDPPEEQAKQINDLLKTAVIDHAKSILGDDGTPAYDRLLADLRDFQQKALESAGTKIDDIEGRLNEIIASIFVDHEVQYDQPFEPHGDKSITLFPGGGRLLLGPKEGHKSALEYQGSGTRRTLLWAALQILSEEKATSTRPHVLLIDEPELCLHPNAIREACRVLYDLAQRPGWQVMVTTHSPVFIDLARDNTSIVRVERKDGGVSGVTLFRPEKAALGADDKENLKLLNLYDPYVAEFFFGGRVVVVEGDTEYAAFKYVISLEPKGFEDVHIIRARGKVTIASLAKILNHFGARYSILHDSDVQTIEVHEKKTGGMKVMANPAWTNNEKIRVAVQGAPETTKIRLVASLPNFELAYFGKSLKSEKPYAAIERLKADAEHFKNIHALLKALVDHEAPLPQGALAWNNLEALAAEVIKVAP